MMTTEQKLARRIIRMVVAKATCDYGDFVMAQLQMEEDLSTTDLEQKIVNAIKHYKERL